MTDETLVANVKEVGKQFLDLSREAEKRGYEVRVKHSYAAGVGATQEIEVLRKV